VKRFWSRALGWLGRRLFAQLHTQLREINERLSSVSARLDDVQAVVEASSARAATLTEQSLGVVESDARTAKRFAEIERRLGAVPPGDR
jgi:hypothetical protein